MRRLVGDITDLKYWGSVVGEWWEIGSGTWKLENNALKGTRGHDPEWTWISSPYPYPSGFELRFDVSGEATMVRCMILYG